MRLTDQALNRADKLKDAGRLTTGDRMTFAWGWAEGYRAARRAAEALRNR
jgi:hypothetical protein